MTSSSHRTTPLLVVLVAVAGVVACSWVPLGGADAATARRVPGVFVSAPATVTGQDVVRVRARVRPAVRGAWVRLEERRGSTWRVVDRGRQDRTGRVRLELADARWGPHRLRVVTGGERRVRSAVVVSRVAPTATARLLPQSPEGVDLPVVAQVRPARAGTPVVLQVRRGTGWVSVDGARLDRAGRAALALPAPARGPQRVRVVVPAVRGATPTVASPVVLTQVVPALSAPVPPVSPEGLDVVVPVRLLQGEPGRAVVLQEQRDDLWQVVDTTALDAGGRARLVLPEPALGVHRLRVLAPATAAGPALDTPAALVRVTPGSDVVGRTPDGRPADIGSLYGADVSGDARTVAVAVPPERLFPGAQGRTTIVVVDRLLGTTRALPLPPDGIASGPALSADGRVVAFARGVPTNQGGGREQQLVVHDVATGLERVFGDLDARWAVDISADGRHVVAMGERARACYGLPAAETTSGQTAHVVRVDVLTGRTQCLVYGRTDQTSSSGNAVGDPQISADGQTVAVVRRWGDRTTGPFLSAIELRRGTQSATLPVPGTVTGSLRMSADARRLAVQTVRVRDQDDEIYDIGLWDLDALGYRTLTAGYSRGATDPLMSGDGRSVFFSSFTPELEASRTCLYRQDLLDGTTTQFACDPDDAELDNRAVSFDGTALLAALEEGDPGRLTVTTKPFS